MKKITRVLIVTSIVINLSACAVFTEVSSSTSSTSDAVTPDVTLNEFVNKRYVAIRHDAAKGGGENLDALAQLLGKNDKDAFANQMQNNFDVIFKNIKQPSEIIARIESQFISKKS